MAAMKCPHCAGMKQKMSDMQSKMDAYDQEEEGEGEGKQDSMKDAGKEKMPSITDMGSSMMAPKKSYKKTW